MNLQELLNKPHLVPTISALIDEFIKNLASKPMWKITDNSNVWFPLFWSVKPTRQSAKCLMWSGFKDLADNLAKAKEIVNGYCIKLDNQRWRLPTFEELFAYTHAPNNPQRSGQAYRLDDKYGFFTDTERVDVDEGRWERGNDLPGSIISTLDIDFCRIEHLQWLIDKNQSLYPAELTKNADILQPFLQKLKEQIALQETIYELEQARQALDFDLDGLFNRLFKRGERLKFVTKESPLAALLPDLDYVSVRQPKLENAEWSDPNKGLWELWGADENLLAEQGLRARNPVLDIQESQVAIDFGTSATVVAYDDHGVKKLLRIGVRDYYQKTEQAHFENPTILEFIDLPEVLAAWQDSAYRPAMNWDDVRCSHEALHNFRNNETNPVVVGSILPKLKQWALREAADYRVQITDQKNGLEHILAPLTLRTPVKGQALTVSNSDPFDPVELYAWFLGMIINGRKLGIHLRYYMTFPVDYPREVKDKILASFKRGLQRSLPGSLVPQPEFEQFSVVERASEPTAYAACAMPALGIDPTQEGAAYAVFDFGGGTADFDFGYYRLPNPEEEDEGYEAVFEHFSPAGDKFLGGENLLENMAYLVFHKNLDVCSQKRIVFTRPLDAKDFPGSEPFLERTQAAATNTLMMMAKLRPIWETGLYANSSGVEKLMLLNCEGNMEQCEFTIPYDELMTYLQERIAQGVENFLVALRKAFAENIPEDIHVLLAGNASRSNLVKGYFGLLAGDEGRGELRDFTHNQLAKLFGERSPILKPHPPLEADAENPHRPTAKTGVALGLLELCPGSVIKVVDHATHGSRSGEAPFAHYIGRFRQGKFQPGLNQGAPYQQWFELGPQRENRFEMVFSESPRAHTGQMEKGDAGLKTKWLDLVGQLEGHKIYARATGPNSFDLCTAVSQEEVRSERFENFMFLKL